MRRASRTWDGGVVKYLERVILGEESGPVSWVTRAFLWPLSLVYRAGLAAYLMAYRLGLRKRYRLPVPVISVGNLSFGGTGKTPAVQAICRMLTQRGMRVVVLSRGHGGRARGSTVVSDGAAVLCESVECGDEPVLLARTLPGVPIVVGKDRRGSGELARREFAPDVIVLDDGMQYWQLHRDLDIAVVSAMRPFGSGLVMPMGDLREPAGGLRRADVVFVNDADTMEEAAYADLVERIHRLAPEADVFRCRAVAVSVKSAVGGPALFARSTNAAHPVIPNVCEESASGASEKADFSQARNDVNNVGGETLDLGWLDGREVIAFCGIGRPVSFRDTLMSLGAVVEEFIAFPDHHRYSERELAEIEAKRKSVVMTTEKDLARLGDPACISNLYALEIKLEIENESRLAEHISRRIDAANQATAA